MRIIDADVLPRHGERGGLVHWKDIEDAPTVEAVSIDDYRSMENTCFKLQKALCETADRKTEPKQEWIPCSDRLPSDGQCVIIQYYDTTGKNHVSVVGACYDDQQGFVDTGYGGMWFGNGNDDVIAWLPLPKPYTADRKTEPQTERRE